MTSSFRGLMQRVRQVALGAYEHQELTLDRVVDAVKPARDPSRHPLFQAMFVLQNTEPASLRSLGLEIEPFNELPAGDSAYFELTLSLEETEQGFHGSLNFNTDLFRPETAARMIQHYQSLLAAAIADPDRPLSAAAAVGPRRATDAPGRLERRAVATSRKAPRFTSCSSRRSSGRRTRWRWSMVRAQWTYRELNERANQLAHYLQARGVGPDQVVAVRLPRSAELIAGLWGVLKAGGAYLPLDPKLPAERLRFTLEDARVDVVVTLDRLRGDLPGGPRHVVCLDSDWEQIACCPAERPAQATGDDQLAYVIYTSGSTGQPKGVMIEHRALVNYAHAVAAEYGITAADRVLQFASVSYDAHVEEVYPCLIRGGTLVLRSDDMLDCKRFLQLCQQWQLTFVTLPTGFWHELTTAIATERLAAAGHGAAVGDWRRGGVARSRGHLVRVRGRSRAAAEHVRADGDDRRGHGGRIEPRRQSRGAVADRAAVGELSGLRARPRAAAGSRGRSRRVVHRRRESGPRVFESTGADGRAVRARSVRPRRRRGCTRRATWSAGAATAVWSSSAAPITR